MPKEKPIHELSVGRIHAKLRELFEKTGTCELCGKERFMRVSAYPYREPATEFAYKFHPEPYTLHREDYYEACSFCHVRFDALNRRKRKEV